MTKRSTPNRPIARAALGSAALLCAALAEAGVWETDATASLSTRYNDNPALIPDANDPESTTSAVAILEADIGYVTPVSEYVLSPRVQRVYYPDRDFSDLETTDWILRASANIRRELIAYGLSLAYDDQSILSSEDTDPNDPDGSGDGTFLRVDDSRERISVTPSITWTPTPKDSISASVSGSTVDYDLDFTGRADFDSYAAALSYNRAVTRRQSVGLSVAWSYYESDRLGLVQTCGGSLTPPLGCLPFVTEVGEFATESTGLSANLLYTFSWTDRTRFNVSVGTQSSDVESFIFAVGDEFMTESTFDSTQYGLGVVTRGQLWELETNLSRSVAPSSNGAPSDKIQLRSALRYRLAENLTASIAGIAYEQESITELRSRKNRFFRGDLSISWRLSRNWAVSGVYVYRRREPVVERFDVELPLPGENLERTSNSLTAVIRYEFD